MSKQSESQDFPLYVSSVEGHLVPRPDKGGLQYFGAKVSSHAERLAGAAPVVWDEKQVIPLTAAFVAQHPLEIQMWLRSKALKKRNAADYSAWLAFEEKRDADELKAAKAAEAKAEAEAKAKAEPKEEAKAQ